MTKIKTMAITCGIFTATFLSFGVVARAADLGGMKDQQTAYDSPAPVSGWTGGYVGGQIGYGWNSHDISVSHAETTPGMSASCKDGATMGDDGKCYTTIETPATEASCKEGSVMREGQCFTKNGRRWELDEAAYIPAQEAKTEKVEVIDAYIPAVDASSTIYNVARSIDTDNLIGGVTVGFDYQAGPAVVGLFGQYNLGDSSTHNNEFNVTINDGNSWMIGARAGGLITPRALVYGLVGYGWQEVAYKSDGDKLEKTFGHLVAGGGFEYKVAKHVTLGVEGQHWFAEKKTLFEDGGDKAVDERSDTRVLASVKYRFGDE